MVTGVQENVADMLVCRLTSSRRIYDMSLLFRFRKLGIILFVTFSIVPCVLFTYYGIGKARRILRVSQHDVREKGKSIPPYYMDTRSEEIFNSSSCDLTTEELEVYPKCRKEIQALEAVWQGDPCLQYHGVNTDPCSKLYFLYKTAKVCPKKPFPYYGQASVRTDKDGLFRILKDPNPRKAYAWIRQRIDQFWNHWVMAIRQLQGEQEMRGRKRKHILLYLGFASRKGGAGFVEMAFSGGPLGEFVQWTDLIITLYILGHSITVTSEIEQLSSIAKSIESPTSACQTHGEFPYDIIYTDYVGYSHMKMSFKGIVNHRCKFRILDTFGTEPKYNLEGKVPKNLNPWGGHNFQPKQMFTTFPHTDDNSVMGFVMQALVNDSQAASIPRLNQALVYGKTSTPFAGKEAYLKLFTDAGLEVHSTVDKPTPGRPPSFVKNHGMMHGLEIHKLLRQSKIFIGLGEPVEGPAPIEAIANGAVFINPRKDPPMGKGAKGWGKKPTSRELTSQQTYAEKFMGEPYVYTVDISSLEEVKKTIDKILQLNKFDSYLPYEFTPEGMLQRMHSYIENQMFCKWPLEDVVSLFLGEKGQSCSETCRKHDRMCEPTHFQAANWKDSLISSGAKCDTIVTQSDVWYPASEPDDNTCYLQANELLFSCAEAAPQLRRLCPCRTFVQGQHALCPGCVDTLA